MRSTSPTKPSERLAELLWGDGDRRAGTVIALLFLVACVAYLLVVHALDIETEVIRDRYWKNAVPLFEGEFPVMEYPPLAILFIAIPRLFGSTPWGYETAYVALVYVFMVIGLWLISRLAADLGASRTRAMVAYAVLTLLMLEFVLDRFDVFVMVVTLMSFVLLVERRPTWAFVLLAVGVLIKVYPAILLPVYMIYLYYDGRGRDALYGFASFAVTGVVVVAAFVLIDPDIMTNFISYNTDRPLQIESVASSVVYLLSMLGLTDVWIQGSSAESFWSDNLRGDLPDAVAGWMMPLMIVCVVLCWLLYMHRCRNGGTDLRALGLAVTLCLLAFLSTNKVYSSQYVIWLIAPLVFNLMASDGRHGRDLLRLAVLCIILTQANFAYNIGYLGGGDAIDAAGMLIILARNVVTVAMLLMVAREMAGPILGSRGGRRQPLSKSTS